MKDFLKGSGLRLSFFRSAPVRVACGQKVLATQVFGATTLFSRGSGLMFRHLKAGQAMLFVLPCPVRVSLHMFFVFSPLDVVFCRAEEEGLRIVALKEHLRPFSLHTSPEFSDVFVEFPSGTAAGVALGELLSCQPARIGHPVDVNPIR